MKQEHPSWLEPIKQQLDASARDLDAQTLSRLNRARQQALAAAPAHPRSWQWLALATAASIALAVFLLPRPSSMTTPIEPPAIADSAEDFELLMDADQLSLYSDMDFYAWLESQDLEG